MWKRLDEKKLKNVGGTHSRAFRAYGLEGKPFPRIVFSIYKGWDTSELTIKFGISRKDKAGDIWYETEMPIELLEDYIEFLSEFKSREL